VVLMNCMMMAIDAFDPEDFCETVVQWNMVKDV
jgi:hypothetical protein